jgi:hypothetical protein
MITTFNDVQAKIENEGFDYCFRDYSDFKDVKDEEFHKLRLAYKKAADVLEQYVEDHIEPEDEEEEEE